MNNLPFVDARIGVINPSPLLQDMARAVMFSSERFGHQVSTVPTAALPISFELQTTTRTDPNAKYLTSGVLPTLTVGPLPDAFGVNNG